MTASFDPADRLEVHELIARYNRAVDSGDASGWVDTFTEDGTFQSLLVGTFTGRHELEGFAAGFLSDERYTQWAGGQHWIGNVVVDPIGEGTASVLSYHIMFMPRGDRVEGVLMAAHDDVVVKTEAGWKFRLRRVVPWPPGSDPNRWSPPTEGAR